MDLEKILADLGFSARVYFLLNFFLENFQPRSRNLRRNIAESELMMQNYPLIALRGGADTNNIEIEVHSNIHDS